MAKLFYSLEEVCQKLNKSEEEVKTLVTSGQIQEFRDRDRLMFKVEQIDLLAGGDDEDTGEVHLDLDDTSGQSGLGLSASGIPLEDTNAGRSRSPFDSDPGGEENEDSGGSRNFDEDLSLDAVGSGSGLLDLTRESDDTSLGALNFEEVYSGEEHIEIPANASGLFEAATSESIGGDEAMAASGIAAMPVVIEAYDGSGSGLSAGLMIGAMAALICTGIIAVSIAAGTTPMLAMEMSKQLMIWAGGLLGLTIILGLIGFIIGKATE